jgi:flagellar basal body-associated protein FliL
MEKAKYREKQLLSKKKGLLTSLILVIILALAFLALGFYFYADSQ